MLQHRDRNRLAVFRKRGQPADDRGDARNPERDPKDRQSSPAPRPTPASPTATSGIWSSNGPTSSAALVETQRGKGTTLTAFGEKLAWAGRQHAGAPRPAAGKPSQELATEIKPIPAPAPVGDPRPRQPRLCGFKAARVARTANPASASICAYVSNQNSLVSLAQGACDLSGDASAARRAALRKAFRPAGNGSIRAKTA